MREFAKSLLVMLCSTVLALLVAEAAFRAYSGKRVLALTPYRTANIVYQEFPKNVMLYDPLLGWSMNAGVRAPAFNTIDLGIRRNGPTDDHLRTGGILVTGASFTIGSEVKDEETWPAQLEELLGQPVVNGAVGGFGVDQIVLRAEELMPVVKPQILVVDLVQDNIATAGYSYSGYPKPYFTAENEQLTLHNNPVPQHKAGAAHSEDLKNFLSYSLMVDRVMATYFPDAWYSSRTQNFTRADNDEVKVSCLLLQRLKKEADDAGIRLLVNMQYGAGTLMNAVRPDGGTRLFESCITDLGIQLVDEFQDMKALLQSNPERFKTMYVEEPGGVLGHKSRAGNRRAADAMVAALGASQPARGIASPTIAEMKKGTEIAAVTPLSTNVSPTLFEATPIATLHLKSPGFYELEATGDPGEHYVGAWVSVGAGTVTFSVEVRPRGTSNLRLQLFDVGDDSEKDGVIGEFDLGRKSAAAWRLGVATKIRAGVSPLTDNWDLVWVTAAVPASENGRTRIIVQLADGSGKVSFEPDGTTLDIRHVVVEHGDLPQGAQADTTPSR